MRTKYFHSYPGEKEANRGRDASGDWMGGGHKRAPGMVGDRLVQATLLERAWLKWWTPDFTVGPDYVASWEDCPMGFAMFKIKSLNSFLDRCAIETDQYSYALFDLWTKTGFGPTAGSSKREAIVWDIREYQLSAEDEMLIKLSI